MWDPEVWRRHLLEWGKDLGTDQWEGHPAVCQGFSRLSGTIHVCNTKNHCKFAPNALRVSKMNIADGGKNTLPMWTTLVPDEDCPDRGCNQTMVLVDTGISKGLWTVLVERGLWPTTGSCFLTQCCIKTTFGKSKLNPLCLKGCFSCANGLLGLEPDFAAQKGEIQETIEAAGHLVLFYPLFHCELNFIQYYWDATKHFTHQNCGFDFPSLKRLVPRHWHRFQILWF